MLFNAKVRSPRRALYNVRHASPGSIEFILEAGEAHGITNKTQFAVFKDKKMTECVGSVIAKQPTPFHTRCTIIGDTFTLSGPAYALLTQVGEKQDIRLFVEANDAFIDLFVRLAKEMELDDTSKRSFKLVNTPNDEPDLALSVNEGFVRFHVMEQVCRDYGLTVMPFDNVRVEETDYLMSILRSAADFYWNLHHSNKSGTLSSKVNLECIQLVPSGEVDNDFDPIVVPAADSNGQEVNLNVGGMIIIDIEEDARYGFRIKNTSDVPLYVALFYFDASDLSVGASLFFHLEGLRLLTSNTREVLHTQFSSGRQG